MIEMTFDEVVMTNTKGAYCTVKNRAPVIEDDGAVVLTISRILERSLPVHGGAPER